jgi:hypothetical protein
VVRVDEQVHLAEVAAVLVDSVPAQVLPLLLELHIR